jgi:hypothetical protein
MVWVAVAVRATAKRAKDELKARQLLDARFGSVSLDDGLSVGFPMVIAGADEWAVVAGSTSAEGILGELRILELELVPKPRKRNKQTPPARAFSRSPVDAVLAELQVARPPLLASPGLTDCRTANRLSPAMQNTELAMHKADLLQVPSPPLPSRRRTLTASCPATRRPAARVRRRQQRRLSVARTAHPSRCPGWPTTRASSARCSSTFGCCTLKATRGGMARGGSTAATAPTPWAAQAPPRSESSALLHGRPTRPSSAAVPVPALAPVPGAPPEWEEPVG